MNINQTYPENQNCYICDSKAVEIYSSGIAPVSGALCKNCLRLEAENLDIIHMWISEHGGLETVPEFSSQIKSHNDGEYIKWPKIAELYQRWEPEIRDSFNSDHNDIVLIDVVENEPL